MGGGRGVENRAEKRSIVKLAQGWGHRRFGLDLMEESRNDRPAVLAEEEGSGGGDDDDDLAEADTEGRKCNRSQELEIESNFLHLLALSLLFSPSQSHFRSLLPTKRVSLHKEGTVEEEEASRSR